MRRITLVSISLMASVAAVTLPASSASAKKPVPPFETIEGELVSVINPGAPVQWNAHDVSISLAKSATVQCTLSQLQGKLITNGEKTDSFSISGGTFADEGPDGPQPCQYTAPSGAGPAHILFEPVPPEPEGTFKVNGKDKMGAFGISVGLEPPEGGELKCPYRFKKILGEFNTDGNPVVVSIKNQKFSLAPGASPSCAKKGTMTADWSLSAQVPASGMYEPVVIGG